MRESEKRQAFLIQLGDALRAEMNPRQIGGLAVSMLGEFTGADRCYFCEINLVQDRVTVLADVFAPPLSSIVGDYRFSEFPDLTRRVGEALAFDDVQNDPWLSDTDKSAMAALNMGAFITKTLQNGESSYWALTLTMRSARIWSASEKLLLDEVAEKVWTAVNRSKAETVLRDTQEQAFLLKLSDALRRLNDPKDVQRLACGILGEHLQADRVVYAIICPDDVHVELSDNYIATGVSPLTGRLKIAEPGGWPLKQLRSGSSLVVADTHASDVLNAHERASYTACRRERLHSCG